MGVLNPFTCQCRRSLGKCVVPISSRKSGLVYISRKVDAFLTDVVPTFVFDILSVIDSMVYERVKNVKCSTHLSLHCDP